MRDPARSHSIRHRSITETAETTACWCSTHAGPYVGRRWQALAFSARRERRRGRMPEGDSVFRLAASHGLRARSPRRRPATHEGRGRRRGSPRSDPLRDDWSAEEAVRRLLRDPGERVAAALLDQRNVAGFGNRCANELCFLRGVHPDTAMADVAALVALGARCLRFSATQPGAHQITTGNARKGEQRWVAGRAGKPCLRCGTSVRVRAEVPNNPGRRRTWWCPHCQPMRPCS